MAYHPGSQRTVLFGGQLDDLLRTLSDETWTWNGRVWSKVVPQGASPPARTGAAMAYDAPTKKLVLFGGTGAAGDLDDTWTWDGSGWTKEKPAVSPPGGPLDSSPRLLGAGSVAQHPISGQAVVLRAPCGWGGGCEDDAWVWGGEGLEKTWRRHSLARRLAACSWVPAPTSWSSSP